MRYFIEGDKNSRDKIKKASGILFHWLII